MSRITYSCSNCNWKETVIAAWGDLKPKLCPDCSTSFIKNPDKLHKILPEIVTSSLETVMISEEDSQEKDQKNGKRSIQKRSS